MHSRFVIFLAVLILAPVASLAQHRDTLEAALPAITIEASRALETESTAPFSVAVRERSSHALATDPGLTLTRVLRGLPGVQLNDRGHYALGERLLIRGMGYRAAFGVRGAQVVLDGIPLTLPDGQTTLDVADPAFVRRAELIRGPSSLYWGNASGGVLFLTTGDTSLARVRIMGGSHGLRQASGSSNLRMGRFDFRAYASRVARNGYRAHSEGSFTRAGLRGRITLGAKTSMHVVVASAVQDVQAPGGLTLTQVQADPRQADPRYVARQAGKQSTQVQGGVTLRRETTLGLFTVTAYGLGRKLDNPLTFAYIDLQRAAGGMRLQFQGSHARLGWGVGLDTGWQRDDRRNANNDGGMRGTERRLDQEERVRNLAAFAVVRLALTRRLSATTGLRLDGIRFAMTDRLLTNGNQSGERNFRALSPSLGLSYDAGGAVVFANVSTAFETPTTTELVNRPLGDGGFHPTLAPQRTVGVELGMRTRASAARLHADIALYRLQISGRLLPRQNAEGRTYFENAGANTHQGVELALDWQATASTNIRATYGGNHYTFSSAPEAGRRIPGVPDHRLFLSLRSEYQGVSGEIAAAVASGVYADSDNTARDDGHVVVDFYAAYEGLRISSVRLLPFLRLQNVLGAQYNGAVVVNAFGGRYYEPAAGRTVQIGFSAVL